MGIGNGFFNGLYEGQSMQCYIHGSRDGKHHPARYLIPDAYARYQTVNEVGNQLDVVIIADGYLIRDDYRLYGFIPKGCLNELMFLVPRTRQKECWKLLIWMHERGDV